MLEKVLNYVLQRIGFKTGIKRHIENSEDVDVNEQHCKRRRIEKPVVQRVFTSDQFLRPNPNWKMPKKRPVISCHQQKQHFDVLQTASHPECSWFEKCKENFIEVPDDEDTAVLGVWQDANTLRKCPVFKATGASKKTTGAAFVDLSADDDDDDTDDNDIQVIKVVESHSSEIARSGNTISIYQTSQRPSSSRDFATNSGNLKKSEVLHHLKSSRSVATGDGNGSHIGTLSTSSCTEEKTKLALYESYKLEEKRQYLQLLQKFTNVPLQAQNRHPRSIWNTCGRTVPQRGESSWCFNYSGSAREKLSPELIDLTKPQKCRSLSRKCIEVRRDREAEPYTAASNKHEGDASQTVHFPFTRINSLADSFKSNFFCQEDFLTDINEKYKMKREAREKQEEEEKLKASYFQEREKKLQEEALERMTKYLKITDAILDDVIIEEEKVSLPELTPEMQAVINAALIPRPPNELLVEGFGLSIKRHDMHTLANLNWLNDEVINFYMELLKERGKLENYPSVYAFNTFFYPRLLSGGHAALKRWTRKVDIFSHDLIIVPVHLGVHWCLATIDFRKKTVRYYDSMGSANNQCLQSLLKYLQDESLDKKKKVFDTSGWQTKNIQSIPQQMNGSDCGVFSCTFAEFICRGADITFTQQDMPYFRHKMVYEIYTRKLLM